MVLDDTDNEILRQLEGAEGLSTKEMAAGLGLSTRATRSRLARLVEAQLISEIGTGPNDPRRRYYLAN